MLWRVSENGWGDWDGECNNFYFFGIIVHPSNDDDQFVILPKDEGITFYDIRKAIEEQGIEIPFDLWRFHVEAGTISSKHEMTYCFDEFYMKGQGNSNSPFLINIKSIDSDSGEEEGSELVIVDN